jgi:hypothetical protein
MNEGSTGDSAPSEARKRGSGGGSPRKYDDLTKLTVVNTVRRTTSFSLQTLRGSIRFKVRRSSGCAFSGGSKLVNRAFLGETPP